MPKSKLIRRDFMKKFKRFLTATIFTTLSILSIAMTPIEATTITTTYTLQGKITNLDDITNIVTVTDTTGEMWQFKGIKGYELAEKITMTMNDNRTNNITDDIIVSVKAN
nr:MAG TPA: hypothetical protein [Caudoviricetes sp.]